MQAFQGFFGLRERERKRESAKPRPNSKWHFSRSSLSFRGLETQKPSLSIAVVLRTASRKSSLVLSLSLFRVVPYHRSPPSSPFVSSLDRFLQQPTWAELASDSALCFFNQFEVHNVGLATFCFIKAYIPSLYPFEKDPVACPPYHHPLL